jgi:hypothetical protein
MMLFGAVGPVLRKISIPNPENSFQVVWRSRSGAGSMLCFFKMLATVFQGGVTAAAEEHANAAMIEKNRSTNPTL